jgi:hypothetical protein
LTKSEAKKKSSNSTSSRITQVEGPTIVASIDKVVEAKEMPLYEPL